MSRSLDTLKQQPLVDFISRKYGYTFKGSGKEVQLYDTELHSCFVNTDKQTFHWFAKGKGGSVVDFVCLVENVDTRAAIEIVKEFYEGVEVSIPRRKTIVEGKKTVGTHVDANVVRGTIARLSVEGKEYWWNRGISEATLEYASVGQIFRYNREWFTFPVYSKDGEVEFLKLRMCPWSRVGDEPKGASFPSGNSPTLYGRQFLQSDTEEIVLCEGESDVLMCLQHDSVALSGTNGCGVWKHEWSKEIASYTSIKRIILAYDRDEAGIAGEEKVIESLSQHAPAIELVRYPWPAGFTGDLSDFLLSL